MRTTLEIPTPTGLDRVKIHTRARTHLGNLLGFWVTINGTKYFEGRLRAQEAQDAAFARWVKENR